MPTFEVKSAPPMSAARVAAAPAPVLGAAQAELEHRLAAADLVQAGRLGGDERLVVELVEQRRLQDLGHGERARTTVRGTLGAPRAPRGWRAG